MLGQWLGGWRRERGGDQRDSWFGSSPFSSDLWDPFGGSRWIQPRGGDDQGDDIAALALPNVDRRETNRAHIFRVDLPGVGRGEVKVQVEDGNILQISGERVKEVVDTKKKWHLVERQKGGFARRFRLPENAKVDEIKCRLENGVLTVEVTKKETQEAPRDVRYIDTRNVIGP